LSDVTNFTYIVNIRDRRKCVTTVMGKRNAAISGIAGEGTSAPAKVDLYRKSGQNPGKFGHRCFDTFVLIV